MHRLYEDDLAGHVMAQDDWDVVRFPALAEEEKVWMQWQHGRGAVASRALVAVISRRHTHRPRPG
jgi:hypothetical protein